jgi:hypothetical protein
MATLTRTSRTSSTESTQSTASTYSAESTQSTASTESTQSTKYHYYDPKNNMSCELGVIPKGSDHLHLDEPKKYSIAANSAKKVGKIALSIIAVIAGVLSITGILGLFGGGTAIAVSSSGSFFSGYSAKNIRVRKLDNERFDIKEKEAIEAIRKNTFSARKPIAPPRVPQITEEWL